MPTRDFEARLALISTPARIQQMQFPRHPKRLDGFGYDRPGPAFHCRLGCYDRTPYLAAPKVAEVVVEALRFRHSRSAEILAFCLMPDHAHLLVTLLGENRTLSRWIGDLKRWTVRNARANAGQDLAWQPNFYEHVLRKSEDLTVVARYILENPVRKGLVARWQDFSWCGSLAWRIED